MNHLAIVEYDVATTSTFLWTVDRPTEGVAVHLPMAGGLPPQDNSHALSPDESLGMALLPVAAVGLRPRIAGGLVTHGVGPTW